MQGQAAKWGGGGLGFRLPALVYDCLLLLLG